jgi:hypothetical protein
MTGYFVFVPEEHFDPKFLSTSNNSPGVFFSPYHKLSSHTAKIGKNTY